MLFSTICARPDRCSLDQALNWKNSDVVFMVHVFLTKVAKLLRNCEESCWLLHNYPLTFIKRRKPIVPPPDIVIEGLENGSFLFDEPLKNFEVTTTYLLVI